MFQVGTQYYNSSKIIINCLHACTQYSHSSEITLKELKLSCNGSKYAQASILQGDLLPLEISFSTFIPNGVLLHASNLEDMVSSCAILTKFDEQVLLYLVISYFMLLGRPASFKSVLFLDTLP